MSSPFAEDVAQQAMRWELPRLSAEQPAPPPTADEIDSIERAAYEDGFARGHVDGEARGYADGARLVREQADRLHALFDHLTRPLEALDTEVERMIVALAIDIGRRLAQDSLQQEPQRITGIVREALAMLSEPVREARIHLHPQDIALVDATLGEVSRVERWHLVADAELQRGDCRVVTESVQIDGRLDTREAGIAQALLGERR